MASVAAGVGGLAATGLLGQIERNHPKAFKGVSTEARGEAKARKELDPGCVVTRLPAPITADELDLPAGRAP